MNAVIGADPVAGPERAADDPRATYAADVFSDVLNQPARRFQRKLVDSGLWQSIGVNYYTLNQVGPITISGEATPDKLREALAALDARDRRGGRSRATSRSEAVEAVKAHAHRRLDGEPRARVRVRAPARLLVGRHGLDYFIGYVDTMAKQTPDGSSRVRGEVHRRQAARHRRGALAETRRALKLTEAELAAPGGTQ